jgi:type I restriction enzyme, S subunit
VQDGFLDLGIVKTIAIYEDDKEKWLLKHGDILLTEGGDWGTSLVEEGLA